MMRHDPVTVLSGVGAVRAKALEKLGLCTCGDLLRHYPRGYEDRTRLFSIAGAPSDVPVCIRALIAEPPRLARIRKGLELVKLSAVDEGGRLELTFFNQGYLRQSLQVGEEYVFFGVAEGTGARRKMTNPAVEKVGTDRFTGRLLPRYPLTAGVSQALLLSLVEQVLPLSEAVEDLLPQALRQEYALPVLRFALQNIHFPENWEALEAARRRLGFEELFFFSLGLALLRQRREETAARPLAPRPVEDFLALLPFAPTVAQRRAMEDIAADLSGGRPMNRLLQGDVGSGKTAVAAWAGWLAVQNGTQAALMAPTELLAEQHFRTLQALLSPAGVRVGLLTGSLPAAQKRKVRTALEQGEVDFVVGTHALLSKGVAFRDLALVITDEQHRFGVDQRALLAEKGRRDTPPHILVMSATPIPRTLSLILYGDLDVSLLDELPPGRSPVETFLVGGDKRERMLGFVRKQVAAGRQVYVVCPMVEEGEEETTADLKSAQAYCKTLSEEVFPDLRVGLVHGKLNPKEKEAAMRAFAQGETDILVSTTVIEVGVDVPNASLMVIENAERFGLSQLHQLRGRVGRGQHQSYCVLVSDHRDPDTRARLKALCATNDGFQIAEEDLKLRGPGDFFGSRQHGLPQMRGGGLLQDLVLLKQTQEAAQAILERDPGLTLPEHRGLLGRVRSLFETEGSRLN